MTVFKNKKKRGALLLLQISLMIWLSLLPTTADAFFIGYLLDMAFFFFVREPNNNDSEEEQSPTMSPTTASKQQKDNIFLRSTPTSSSIPTTSPSTIPSSIPTSSPNPTSSMMPTSSTIPSTTPSFSPTPLPTTSTKPSRTPTSSTMPSSTPSFNPTSSPTITPSSMPTREWPIPNIVIFYADDMDSDAVLNSIVKTPHLDTLKEEGMTFPSNCVIFSQCWVSRATLVTGMYASVHQHLKVGSDAMFNGVVPWNETLFPQLKSSGYHVGYVGKWHANTDEPFMSQAFDYTNFYHGSHLVERDGQTRHVTELNQVDALEFLQQRPQNQTFALQVAFFAPHTWNSEEFPRVYTPQNYTETLYDNTTMPVPVTSTVEAFENLPWFFTEENEARKKWRKVYEPDYQLSKKRYSRLVSEVDDVVGAVIAELKAQGVYNNTLIIFTADNGHLHGEHQLSGKWFPFDESIRVPLIIKDPRMPIDTQGTINDEFTLSHDLAPTILSAAKIPVPSRMQGYDISQLYLYPDGETAQSWRQDFFYEMNRGDPITANGHSPIMEEPAVFALVQKDWKYIYWPQSGDEQLFHTKDDPYQQFDLRNDTTSQANIDKLEELRERYNLMKTNAQGGFKA